MRFFMALPLALLITPIASAFEVPSYDLPQDTQEKQSSDTFRHFMTGLDFYNGWGERPRDYLQAVKYFELAARGGHNQAQHYLGLMYYKGIGVTKDNIEAYKWFDLAASNGDKVGVVLKITLKELLTAQEIEEAERREQVWLNAASSN